jgi:hypothetical protein
MLFVSVAPLGILAVSLLVATHDSSGLPDGSPIDPSNEMTSAYVDTGYRQ